MHAVWTAREPIPEAVLARVLAQFRPDDEWLCAWVDEQDSHKLVISFDLMAPSYEEAARACTLAVAPVAQLGGLDWQLSQVGASTEEGQWASDDPSSDLAG